MCFWPNVSYYAPFSCSWASPSGSWCLPYWCPTWTTRRSWRTTSETCSSSRRAWPPCSSSWLSLVRLKVSIPNVSVKSLCCVDMSGVFGCIKCRFTGLGKLIFPLCTSGSTSYKQSNEAPLVRYSFGGSLSWRSADLNSGPQSWTNLMLCSRGSKREAEKEKERAL